MWYILGLYRDNGKENYNYYKDHMILGSYRVYNTNSKIFWVFAGWDPAQLYEGMLDRGLT